jgi:hypothetical protein
LNGTSGDKPGVFSGRIGTIMDEIRTATPNRRMIEPTLIGNLDKGSFDAAGFRLASG